MSYLKWEIREVMKYYSLIYNGNDAVDKNHIVCQEILNDDNPDYTVCTGKKVDNWNSNITLVCNDPSETVVPDWLSQPNGWFVVSKRFVDTVSQLENGAIQYLPVKLDACQPQMQSEEYYVANVIEILDAVDFNNSVCFNICNKTGIIKYALKDGIIKNHHIFKVKTETISFPTFVSEDFKKAVRKAKLSGFSFTEVKVV